MTKIDVYSGFLGAGKTTLIRKMIKEAYEGEKVVLIENEFGEIGVDGGFLRDAGVEITEMNSGCICCSLVGDFSRALAEVLSRFSPDRVVIEPSGVGKLSDVARAVQEACAGRAVLNGLTTVVDINKCKMYMKNFGEFFNDQIASATAIVLSHTQSATDEKIREGVALLRAQNPTAVCITASWDGLDGKRILEAIENPDAAEKALESLLAEEKKRASYDERAQQGMSCHQHENGGETCCHHHDHDEEDRCGHHHEHEGECCHHHDHGEDSCTCHRDHGEDAGDHVHGEGCTCHHHGDRHHHGDGHHHAEDVFSSFGRETACRYTKEELMRALQAFAEDPSYGTILRAKGIVASADGGFLHFDYVPGEPDVREGAADVTGRLCVIGADLNTEAIARLFRLA